MAEIPKGATTLITIGEIDCRLNEGILRYLNNHPGHSIQDVVEKTIDDFLDYISVIGSSRNLIISGVPATNIPAGLLQKSEADSLTMLLVLFNEQLRRKVKDMGMEFLDVFALTNRGDGFASGEYHVDRYHLLPSATETAFANHCS